PTGVGSRSATSRRNTLSVVAGAGFSLPRHEAFAITVGFVVIGLGFVIDVTAGRDLSLSIVYVGGVGLMTWTGRLRVRVVGAVGGGAAVVIAGVPTWVVTGGAGTRGVTAFVLPLAPAAVTDRLHSMMVREASRARFAPLPGLSNRRACEERCAVEIARLQRR